MQTSGPAGGDSAGSSRSRTRFMGQRNSPTVGLVLTQKSCQSVYIELLAAEAAISRFGFRLLPSVRTNVPAEVSQPPRHRRTTAAAGAREAPRRARSGSPTVYDVAISFAGPQSDLAERLAKRVRDTGFEVFYDGFCPEQLWGKDLAVFFDDVFRKQARYCVILVSEEYVERDWTNHERQSAVARMIESKGQDFILPVKIHDVELPGVQPTIGYLSLKEIDIDQLSEILIAKLRQ